MLVNAQYQHQAYFLICSYCLVARQNRTLQFSLAEPTCMNRGWASVGNEGETNNY